jgi:hypothetical protein
MHICKCDHAVNSAQIIEILLKMQASRMQVKARGAVASHPFQATRCITRRPLCVRVTAAASTTATSFFDYEVGGGPWGLDNERDWIMTFHDFPHHKIRPSDIRARHQL